MGELGRGAHARRDAGGDGGSKRGRGGASEAAREGHCSVVRSPPPGGPPPPPLPPCSAVNLMKWTCGIPGKAGTDWEGGVYPLTIEFSEDYPAKPPKVRERGRERGRERCVCGHAGA